MKNIPSFEEFLLESNKIVSTPEYVGVYYRGAGIQPAVCDISNVGDGVWYINRVHVPDGVGKSHGIGSSILQDAIKDILKKYNPKSIFVTPGGYDQEADPDKRDKFYKKNGFIEHPKQKEVLYYRDLEIPDINI